MQNEEVSRGKEESENPNQNIMLIRSNFME
jgi:hypothetical protein